MITERENRALCIAKSAYQHFTKDALDIARQIIALEREMVEDQDNSVTIPVILQPTPVANSIEIAEVPTSIDGIQPKPMKETTSIRIAGPLNYARMQQEEQPAKREFVEVPY